mgnify:CR=1 FL=1
MRVEFDGGDLGVGISIGDGESFAAGGGAAVEDVGPGAYERGNELRGFVLDDDSAFAEGGSFGDVSGLNAAGGGEECAGQELDSFGCEFFFGIRRA